MDTPHIQYTMPSEKYPAKTSPNSKVWTTKDFDFDLPDRLIAQRPSVHRGGSRLMGLPTHGDPFFTMFHHLTDLFRGDEILILNDTKVVPARLHGRNDTGGRVEVFFLESLQDNR